MTDIQFDEDQKPFQSIVPPHQSAFVRLVLKTGIVSTTRNAEYVLLGFVGICVVVIVLVLTLSGHTSSPSAVVGPPRITPNP
ncbi:MAG TPA: hypothetical protein VMV38_02150 [Candidatus Paceibacterota bacterium]|nr:hypothetical protein [Candidatus Paceibacterota bacterium]